MELVMSMLKVLMQLESVLALVTIMVEVQVKVGAIFKVKALSIVASMVIFKAKFEVKFMKIPMAMSQLSESMTRH